MTQGAWTDRASVSDAAGIFKGLGEVANTTASSIMGFAQALPEEYQAQVLARLNAETVSFGRGSTAGREGVTDYGPSTWNFQFRMTRNSFGRSSIPPGKISSALC